MKLWGRMKGCGPREIKFLRLSNRFLQGWEREPRVARQASPKKTSGINLNPVGMNYSHFVSEDGIAVVGRGERPDSDPNYFKDARSTPPWRNSTGDRIVSVSRKFSSFRNFVAAPNAWRNERRTRSKFYFVVIPSGDERSGCFSTAVKRFAIDMLFVIHTDRSQ